MKCLEVTLSSDLLVQWANLWGLSNRKKDFRYKRNSLSKHFTMIGMNATGQKSLGAAEEEYFSTGMMVADFKLKGIINDKPGLGLDGNFITILS